MDTKCRSQRCLLLKKELTVYNTKITDDSPLSDTFCKGVTQIFQLKFEIAGLEITAGQRTMSGLIVDLTGQTFVLPVMLTGQNSIVLKMR